MSAQPITLIGFQQEISITCHRVIFRLVFETGIRQVGLTKSSLLLKIKWKQHHYLYRKWAELLLGTASLMTMSDAEKLHAQV